MISVTLKNFNRSSFLINRNRLAAVFKKVITTTAHPPLHHRPHLRPAGAVEEEVGGLEEDGDPLGDPGGDQPDASHLASL